MRISYFWIALVLAANVGQINATADEPTVFSVDPIALAENREVEGKAEHSVVRHGYEYRFESEDSKKKFEAQPEAFEIQLGGACARMGSLSGQGRPDLFARHGGHLFLFASESCRSSFIKAPETLLLLDDPVPQVTDEERMAGNLMVQQFLKSVATSDVLGSLESIQVMTTKKVLSGKTEYVNRQEFAFRTSGDNRHDESWNASRYGRLQSDGAGWFVEPKSTRPMVAVQLRDHRNHLFEQYAGILMELLKPSQTTVVRGLPLHKDGSQTWNQFEWYSNGILKTVTQDGTSGRILRVQFRGQGPTLAVTNVTVEFDNFALAGDLTLPKVSLRLAEGQPKEKGVRSEWAYAVNPELPEDHFRPTGQDVR